MNIDKWLERLRFKKVLGEFSDLSGWRNYYFDLMLFFSLILLPITLVATLPSYLAEKHYEIIAFEIGIAIFLSIIFFMRNPLYRGVLFFFFFSSMILTFFISLGPFYARPGWLVLSSVAAALLFGAPAAMAITGFNAVLLTILYLFIGPHLHSWAPVYLEPVGIWIIFVVNISFISLVASLPVSLLLTRLNLSFSQELDLRKKLSQESEVLQNTNIYLQNEISERKSAEEDLRRSEERYRGILEDMEESYYEVDLDGKFTFFNSSIARTYGYTEDQITGLSYKEYMDKENMEKVFKAFHHVYVTGETIKGVDWKLRDKEGKVIAVEASVSLRKDSQGEPIGFRGITRDITERNRAEEALRESQQMLRLVLDTIPVRVFWKDRDSNYLGCNSQFSKDAGLGSTEEIIGKDDNMMPWPLQADLYRSYDRSVIETGLPKMNYVQPETRLDGSIAWLRTSKMPLHDAEGRVTGVLGVYEDITERKIMEKAQEESEARYRLLAENASDIIFTMDNNLKFTYISPSVERIRGYTVEEAISQTPEVILTPASLEIAMKAFAEEMEIETRETKELWRTRTIELEETCKNGSTIWTESSFSPLRDEDNKLAGFLGITRDITERKRVEEEKKRLEDQLARTQKIEAIGTLAGGIAHDFNNLLTGILGNVSLVLMKMEESNPFRERLKNIEDYVQRGSDLTKQLLGFARGGKYEVKPTDLGEFIRKSSEMFGRTKKEIHIHYKIQNGLWAADVDRGQMDQVLLNLFVNAWQAMPGGGNLYLSAENVELDYIDVSPYNIRPGKFVKVTVTDTGIGMSEAIKARIFEPFFTTKERDRGTGLGLASVYGIIKNHGGFINVESKEGQGASFMFYLPASEKPPIGDGGSTRDDIQMGSETILLIDDEDMILDIGAKMLEGLNYKVITAVGGKQGLQIYEKERGRIDLVILDMIMPDLSGKETFNAILLINPLVRVLLSSGYSLDDQAREIMQSGCKGFIQKPFTMLELSKKIRGILDGC